MVNKIVITPPPVNIENKQLAIWATAAHNTMKSMNIRIDDIQKKLKYIMDKVKKL